MKPTLLTPESQMLALPRNSRIHLSPKIAPSILISGCRGLKDLVTKTLTRAQKDRAAKKFSQRSSRHLAYSLSAFTLAACSTQELSLPKVTNGKNTLAFPAVVQITQGEASCTASFIRPHVLLTAAHCVDPEGPPVVVPQLMTASSKFIVHPDYAYDFVKDVALVFFDRDLSDTVMSLQFHMPAEGDPVTLVGFGNNRYVAPVKSTGANGVKRFGTNKVDRVSRTIISLVGTNQGFPADSRAPTGERSSGASGDSGGPLLNAAGEILGVASYVSRMEGDAVGTNYAALENLKDFIDANLALAVEKPKFVETCENNFENPHLRKLFSQLTQDDSCMSLYAQLAKATTLTVMRLADDPEAFDVSMLKDLDWLEGLGFTGYKIEALDQIANFRNLAYLHLLGLRSTDLSPLVRSWSLRYVTVSGEHLGDTEALKTIPNLSVLTVNSQKQNDLKPLRDEFFSGTWQQACKKSETLALLGYKKETFVYDPADGSLNLKLDFYPDQDCQKPVAAEILQKYTVMELRPDTSPDLFTLDFAVPKSSSFTVFDDSLFDADLRSKLRRDCPYSLGQPATCSFAPVRGLYTRVKKVGADLFLGTTQDAQATDGFSLQTRHRALDTVPYTAVAN